ncbi:MAG: hypothetical protein A3K19_05600 [Lentisphaerae bacterium RIFOXYB12_FULL_65_16]|nr:MAG: hypothetical protein A3K18_23640 [Lentisphaerae bacterium RIFOXYA12_64_32]OGV94384.1 MAG: hypothetical protein A3K19_05600 [Lentisphaerae bacterium RIFOXYB12_FULL_65_16]
MRPAGRPAQPANILVVDDTPMNVDLLCRRLQRQGYRVDSALDGPSALERVETGTIDLMLLDVMMPGVSGIDVLRRTREKFAASVLPIIMVTARDTTEDIVEALRLGANDYVTKPVDFAVLLARVETHLALKNAVDEVQRLAQDLARRTEFIRRTFGRYLSEEVVASILETPEGLKLGGEMRDVTILMSDIRGFTSVSARLGPEKVVRILNSYLGAMTDVLKEYGGTIDEFIGDAILAIFGAPISYEDHAARAAACALAMQLKMVEVNRDFEKDGLPSLEMGIGIHTGEVIVGNIGSHKRVKYGVVGPPVNLTGRIESFSVGGQVLISETTISRVGDILKLGRAFELQPKGAPDPVVAYELHGIGGPYNVWLPGKVEALVDLEEPMRIRYGTVDGKHAGEARQEATVVRLSANEAEIVTPDPADTLTNLRISMLAEGAPMDNDLYAKVIERIPGGRLLVRFTAVPPAIAAWIQQFLPNRAAK